METLKHPTSSEVQQGPVGGDSAVIKVFAELQDLFANETDIDSYLMRMEAAFNELASAGVMDEHDPFLHQICDKLSAMMDAEMLLIEDKLFQN